MKNRNVLATSILSLISYILRKNDINLVLSLKNIVISIISLAFMINIFAAKNFVNAYKKTIVLSVKNI